MNTKKEKNKNMKVFPVKTVRTVKSPSNEKVSTFYVWVEFRDIPKEMSLEVNPRKPKMGTSVAKQLINAVKDVDTNFDINNRGIVIRAKSFKFNPNNSNGELDLGEDSKKYGVLDGGHTYTAIVEYGQEHLEETKKYVKLEILVGEDLDVSALADARNTSAQVSDIALFELDDKFDIVKEAIANEVYFNEIAYKDNDNKRIAIVELLKLMFAFNVKRYPDDSSAPVASYSGKAAVFTDYKKEYVLKDNIYKELSQEITTLVELYERILMDLPKIYSKYKDEDGKFGRFGSLRGVEANGEHKTLFTNSEIDYGISIGYVLPIFGAFRSLLKLNKEGKLEWTFPPIEIWEKSAVRLVQNTFDTETNPQLAGKNKTLWQSNYRIVDSVKKDKLIEFYMNNK